MSSIQLALWDKPAFLSTKDFAADDAVFVALLRRRSTKKNVQERLGAEVRAPSDAASIHLNPINRFRRP